MGGVYESEFEALKAIAGGAWKNYKQSIKTGLDYIYEYIIGDIVIGKNYISDFTKTISYLQNEDIAYFASYYIEKIINELLKK